MKKSAEERFRIMTTKGKKSVPSPKRNDQNKEEMKRQKILLDRPEFTTLTKVKPLKKKDNNDKKLIQTDKEPNVTTRRDKIANDITYESILHDQIVNMKALQIRYIYICIYIYIYIYIYI
jgi:hypothetical protein